MTFYIGILIYFNYFHELFCSLGLFSWNLSIFRERLPDDIVRKIVNILPPRPLVGSDKVFWMHTSNGDFTVKSAYRMIKKNTWNEQDARWKIVWKY